MPASLSTVQSHISNRNFAVATAVLLTINFFLRNCFLTCLVLYGTFDMLQQQDTLYYGYTKLGSHTQLQIVKSNRSCRHGCMCKLTLLHLPGKGCFSSNFRRRTMINIESMIHSLFLYFLDKSITFQFKTNPISGSKTFLSVCIN